MMQVIEGDTMTERDFVYWLKGFFELTQADKIDKKQMKMIKEHLDLVMYKVTPPLTTTTTSFDMPKLDMGTIIC